MGRRRSYSVLNNQQFPIVGCQQDVHDAIIVKIHHDWCSMHLALVEGWPEIVQCLCPIRTIQNLYFMLAVGFLFAADKLDKINL